MTPDQLAALRARLERARCVEDRLLHGWNMLPPPPTLAWRLRVTPALVARLLRAQARTTRLAAKLRAALAEQPT